MTMKITQIILLNIKYCVYDKQSEIYLDLNWTNQTASVQ